MMCGMWKAMLPVSISEHHCPSSCMDNLSLVDTVIKIPICWFHHKLHLLVFTTAVLVSIIRSSASSSSIVKLYARHGANNGMAAWTRHHKEVLNMSVSSQAPPVSLYNCSFGIHHQNLNDSSASSSSIVKLYTRHGANNGMAAWTRHHKVVSIDSVIRNFSGMHLGCPGLGDKMFNNATADHRPLTSISQHHHQKV